MIFLDTNILIWTAGGNFRRISRAARQAIEREKDIRISPMVFLELGFLHQIGTCTHPPDAVVSNLTRTIGLRVCDHPWSDIAQTAVHLTWTRDPFDRLITAHAHTLKAGLVTADATLHEHYPKAVW